VARRPGAYRLFIDGLDRLTAAGIRVRLKAMAIRSNIHELDEIAAFCRGRTRDFYRFDPMLHLRYDRNPERNTEIISERLTPEEVIAVEQADSERYASLIRGCAELINPEFELRTGNRLFHCGAGAGSFSISYDGRFRLCASLWHPDCVYDLNTGSLTEAWQNFVPRVLDMRSDRREYLERCRVCPVVNLCLWCPAHAFLETGEPDLPVPYFCEVAHARARMLREAAEN